MSGPNVLPQFADELALIERPRQKAYREAVSKVIRDLKSKYSLSNVALAEEVCCSDETISNAENGNNDLNPVTLLSIGWRFGEDALAPIRALYLRESHDRKSVADKLREVLAEVEAA